MLRTLTRRRLDTELVRRGLAGSVDQARELVDAGGVVVRGTVAAKAGTFVDAADAIELRADPEPFVSRGGRKLEAALDAFGIDPAGMRCLDIGASTGGFTDCLLQRGAREVVALDVGRGQLAWSLRSDRRVVVRERTDVRSVTVADLGPVDLVVADLSFISLRTVLPALTGLAGDSDLVVLVKPQFELDRRHVSAGGVVHDDALRRRAVDAVADAARALGRRVEAELESAVRGARGNRESFLHLRSRP